MLDSKGDQQALRVGISTRKSTYGLMNKQIENADKEGRTVRRWTAFEFHQPCEEKRSGKAKQDLYILQDDMETIVPKIWEQKDKAERAKYVKYEMWEGCVKCPLASICLGDAKGQKSKSTMLKPLGDLIQKVKSEGADWTLAQLMNLKPSTEGIIYREFNRGKHVLSWNAMWKRLTGQDYPGICTHDLFVKKCNDMKLPSYAGVDWGWTNPSTVVYFYVGPHDDIFVVRADGVTQVSQPSWIHYIKQKYHRTYRCQMYFPDIADGGAVAEMKKAGLPVSSEVDKKIGPGIQTIKKFLRVPGNEDPKLFIASETCDPLILEFEQYHFKLDAAGECTEIPDSRDDHWLDALRYPMYALFGKNSVILGGSMDFDNEEIVDGSGGYLKAPTAAEFARVNGIEFNNEVDTSKIGQIGRLSDLEEDEEDGVSTGGFLWSFD